MNKQLIAIFIIVLFTLTAKSRVNNVAQFVNPFIGASTNVGDAGIYHGLGKTFFGAATPFDLVQVSSNTITGGDNGSGYSYEHTGIEGFAFTQMSGFYPIAYGNLRYEITSPVFNKVIIQLDAQYTSGKTFTITAKNNSPENVYYTKCHT